MLKRLLCVVLLSVMLSSTCAEIQIGSHAPSNQGETLLTLTVQEGYAIVIPSQVGIPFGALRTDVDIRVTQLLLSSGHVLSVRPQAAGGTLTHDDGMAQIPYRLSVDSSGALNFDTPETRKLQVRINQNDWDAAPAGGYGGTITFSVSITDIE